MENCVIYIKSKLDDFEVGGFTIFFKTQLWVHTYRNNSKIGRTRDFVFFAKPDFDFGFDPKLTKIWVLKYDVRAGTRSGNVYTREYNPGQPDDGDRN